MATLTRPVAVATLVVGLALTGCSQHTNTASQPASTSPSAGAAAHGLDASACSDVKTIVAKMTAATQGWSPTNQPFDAKMKVKILRFANDLAVTADGAATVEVETAVRNSALAFDDLTTAMSTKQRSKVDAAVTQTKVQYAALKKVCSL